MRFPDEHPKYGLEMRIHQGAPSAPAECLSFPEEVDSERVRIGRQRWRAPRGRAQSRRRRGEVTRFGRHHPASSAHDNHPPPTGWGRVDGRREDERNACLGRGPRPSLHTLTYLHPSHPHTRSPFHSFTLSLVHPFTLSPFHPFTRSRPTPRPPEPRRGGRTAARGAARTGPRAAAARRACRARGSRRGAAPGSGPRSGPSTAGAR